MQQVTLENGWFPLQLAVHRRDLVMVRLLLECGADANQQVVLNRPRYKFSAVPGDRPFLLAVRKNNVEAATALLEGGASVDLYAGPGPYHGSTALIRAADGGHLEMLKFLIASGADTATPALYEGVFGCGGITALHEAASGGRLEAVQYLLENGADIYRSDNLGRTAVYRTVESGRYETLRFLSSYRGDDDTPMSLRDMNMPDNDGFTPLMIAFWKGDLDITYFLARHGVDLTDHGRAAFFRADDDYDWAIDRTVVSTLLEAINDAGSWNEYVAGLRMPYILIRHMVSREGLVCPSNYVASPGFAVPVPVPTTKQQALYQFVFGAKDVVWNDGTLLRAASDDVFGVIGSYLGVRLVDDKNA